MAKSLVTFSIACRFVIAVGWLFVFGFSAVYGQTPQAEKSGADVSLRDEPSLQTKVSLAVRGRPLAEALAALSQSQRVKLTCGRQVGEQRVSLFIKDQPLYQVMSRLALMLSHTDNPTNPSHSWSRIPDTKEAGPTFHLVRHQPQDQAEERKARDVPRQKVGDRLTQVRDQLNKVSEERKNDKTNPSPDDIFNRMYDHAIVGLSDKQIRMLSRGQAVSIPASVFADFISAYNAEIARKNEKALIEAKETEKRLGIGPIRPIPIEPISLQQHFQFRLIPNTDGGERPFDETEFALHLDGIVSNGVMILQPLRTEYPGADKPEPNEKIYDLTPLLTPKTARTPGNALDAKQIPQAEQQTARTPGNRLPFVLQALSEVTGLNIVQEHFYKSDSLGSPVSDLPEEYWKGTLAHILRGICYTWDYVAVKQDDTYLLWSNTWAFDRTYDISERLLVPWRKRLKEQGTFTTRDRIALAVEFSWPQLSITLAPALEEEDFPSDKSQYPPGYFGYLGMLHGYRTLRIQGLLTTDQYRAAQLEEGIPVSALSPLLASEVTLFATEGRFKESNPSEANALRQAVPSGRLKLRPRDAGYRDQTFLDVRVETYLSSP